MMFDVDPETCEIVQSAEGRLTLKSAALLAYHVAGEKISRWAEVKSKAWSIYEEEAAKAQAAGSL